MELVLIKFLIPNPIRDTLLTQYMPLKHVWVDTQNTHKHAHTWPRKHPSSIFKSLRKVFPFSSRYHISLLLLRLLQLLPLSLHPVVLLHFPWVRQAAVLPQNAAQLYQPLLHLGNSRELGFEPKLLVLQGNTRGGVQLLKAPAAFAVKLQQVGVVLPASRGSLGQCVLFGFKVMQRCW